MKILMNTQDYLVGGIPRVVKNMIAGNKLHFQDAQFITVNLEKENLKNKDITTVQNIGFKSIEWYYDRGKFTKNLSQYTSLIEIEKDFEDLIQIFANILSKENPWLIILHGTWIVPWCLMKASERHKIPTILYYHGSITIEEDTRIKKWEASILYEFEKSFLKKEHGFIFPSNLLREIICEKFNLDRNMIFHQIISNSVPRYFFHLPKPAIKNTEKPIRVWFIMRWCHVKNKTFVKNFVHYIQSKDLNYRVYLITDKEERVRKDIKDSKYFTIHEQLHHKELNQFLRNTVDIVLCPSLFETYGNIAQESLASGTPALINKNMGIRETYERIWLEHWIIDFENNPLSVIDDIIQTTIASSIPYSAIQILGKEYIPEFVNKKRFDFFTQYMQWFVNKE